MTTTIVEDPALVAAREAQEAHAAFFALADDTRADEQTPEYKAAEKRDTEAEFAFSSAPVTSLAGALIKLRALAKDIVEDGGSDDWCLGHVNTVAAFLEGFAGAPSAPKPDPVVDLFAEWGALEDEINAFLKAHPDYDDSDVEEQISKLCRRKNAVEDQIIATPVTSVGGVAVKLRILTYMKFPMKGLPALYATPAKDTDFEGLVEEWRDCTLGVDDKLLIDSLRDAERLAGVA